MAALHSGAAISSSAQVFHIGRNVQSCTSPPQCPTISLMGRSSPKDPPSCLASAINALRPLRNRLYLQSAMRMQFSQIEQIASIVRDSNVGRISLAPLAHVRDDPLYLVGEYDGEGPIELPPREIEIDPLAIPEAGPAQIVASIFLTGAIFVLSVRALRRRAARSKEVQFRSSGATTSKNIKEEARKAVLDNLKKAPEVRTPPPTVAGTAFGAVVAGVIALGLYKFTSSVDAGFSAKAVSQDYSIRNLTITVRTIISGLCYLATFVFAANSIGLTLYSFQLLLGIGDSDRAPPAEDSVQNEESDPEKNLETKDRSE